MPIIAGQPLYDASGNAVTDASGTAIGEPDLPVSLVGGFLLAAPSVIPWGPIAAAVLEALGPWLADRLFGGDPNAEIDLAAELLTLKNNTATWHPETGLKAQQWDLFAENGFPVEQPIAVEYPPDAPTWYTAPTEPDLSGIPSAVWGEVLDMPHLSGLQSTLAAGQILREAGLAGTLLAGYVGIPVPDRPHWEYLQTTALYATSDIGNWTNTNPSASVPLLDLSLIESGDSVLSYLEREYPTFTYLDAGPGSWPTGGHVYIYAGEGYGYYRCTLTEADMRTTSAATIIESSGLEVDVSTAPVWPGLANVTLGDPVALTDQLELSGPMHGVLVTVTTPPTKTGLRNVGGYPYDYGVGEIAFRSDNGYIEPWQYLGFRTALFAPKSMEQAESALFRVLAGAAGTVRTFTRS